METKKKKISRMHMFRRTMQIAFFLLLPGIFASVFYAVKVIYLAVIGGGTSVNLFAGSCLIVIGTILATVFLGRFFCGFACSFGAMGDLIWFLSKKTVHVKFRPDEKLDRAFKLVKYGILFFILFGIWTFGLVTIDSTSNPWTVFGMYASIGGWTSASYLFSIGGVLLLLIIIGSFFIERFFCRYLCPLGAIFAVVSRVRFFHIRKIRDKCGKCRVCTNACSMGIPLYKYDTVTSGECINCFACVENCPRKNARANPAPAVAAAVSVAAISGLVYVGTVVSAGTLENGSSNKNSTETTTGEGNYTDGTYAGTGTGFRGETKVSVEVENGYITDITVVSYQDDQEYFSRAENSVLSDIINSQSTDVDTVSGATFSSNGIIEAVKNALEGDGGLQDTESGDVASEPDTQTETQDTQTETQNTQTESQDTSDESGSQTYEDGTYTGSGTGFRGDTQVSVTVADGKIEDITIVSYQDDEQFFERAESTVISEIIQEQDVNVDAVSGATYSSNGIMEAVANALGISYTNTNSSGGEAGRSGHGGKGFR